MDHGGVDLRQLQLERLFYFVKTLEDERQLAEDVGVDDCAEEDSDRAEQGLH